MEKYELSKELKTLYTSMKKEPFLVDVPTMNYLIFNGSGHPSEEDFQIACETLFTISYLIKFEIARKKLAIDYKVSPMEVTWYLDKSGVNTQFTWTMMIRQPEFISEALVSEAINIAKQKQKNIAYFRVRFEQVVFGTCVQCFHSGDYNKMNDTLAKMLYYAKEEGLDCEKYTHDIYLNDSRKTKIENYKTIMRLRVLK